VIRLQVEEGLDHEVLSFENEALSQLLDVIFRGISALQQLDVLSGRDLSLFLDLLSFDLIPHLVAVRERIVLADLTKEVCLAHGCANESLFQLEVLKLAVSWQ
jgi:hypothetical protein